MNNDDILDKILACLEPEWIDSEGNRALVHSNNDYPFIYAYIRKDGTSGHGEVTNLDDLPQEVLDIVATGDNH